MERGIDVMVLCLRVMIGGRIVLFLLFESI